MDLLGAADVEVAEDVRDDDGLTADLGLDDEGSISHHEARAV
ncbi:MAG TPA: hypothetical protein RMH26_05340 [Polyangiaceae bacterium LLY-WYZ-15_(1-7)]|nr:hypothetical protein [Polyangiaceae bacterium LLY-WYZ-15_(1-7)]